MEAQDFPISRAPPQRIETRVRLDILRDSLLTGRPAGQPVEKLMHPGQPRREKPVTNDPPLGQARYATLKFTNLKHSVRNPITGHTSL